ncbi:MAG: Pr6Pr family membrane protein [Clostridiales bacterium]|nr:Pr6Pr family membrane protein [Clostridiales bacterium]
MIQNRRFALAFRLGALIFILAGGLTETGVFSGNFKWGYLMYYTMQSNLLAAVLFALLAARTAKALREEGQFGSAGWYSRFEMVCVVGLFLTFIVYWALLAPEFNATYTSWSPWRFGNISVHAVAPLLCLLDYIFFSEAGRLKYRDIYYACIFPLFYGVFVTVAGFAGYVYEYRIGFSNPWLSSPDLFVPVRFPYPFLDFDRIGWAVFAYVGVILAFLLLLGHGIYFIDRKVRKPCE